MGSPMTVESLLRELGHLVEEGYGKNRVVVGYNDEELLLSPLAEDVRVSYQAVKPACESLSLYPSVGAALDAIAASGSMVEIEPVVVIG